jgi:hypothetical protein
MRGTYSDDGAIFEKHVCLLDLFMEVSGLEGDESGH